MMDFLQLSGKHMIVFGVANRKSVAYHIGATLEEIGARVIYVVQNEARRQQVAKLLGDAPCTFAMSSSKIRSDSCAMNWQRFRDPFTGWSTRWPLPITPTA
jgi:enoyl-[acyl-carrier protein] reductase I